MSPWPAADASNILFILDASHRVEESILREWLANEEPGAAFSGEVNQVVVPIAHAPEDIPTLSLARALDVAPTTLIVPLRVVWLSSVDEKGSAPRVRDLLLGNPRRPRVGKARRILNKTPSRVKRIAAEPATLDELRRRFASRFGETANSGQLVDFIAGQASLALDIAERRLRGSRYKVPRRVALNLSTSPRFKAAVQQIGAEQGRSTTDLMKESAEIMNELISIPKTFWLDVMDAFNRRMISLGYETDMVVDQSGLERIRQMTRDYPSALLWTHKTHVDGFAMHHTFFSNDFPAPHILGGVNMAFGGLRQYIGYLLEKRFPLTWAFEGTRSRVGKLMPPRYGLLKYVVEAANAADAENLHIIPIAINYDLIGDVKDYAVEQAGAVLPAWTATAHGSNLRGLRRASSPRKIPIR
jgi:glycerol-3-phosphate O-acyltransferase